MRNLSDIDAGKILGLQHEIIQMLQYAKLKPEEVIFQLKRLADGNKQGLIAQLPTLYQVRAPGGMKPTMERVKDRRRLSLQVQNWPSLCKTAVESYPSDLQGGTMLDVVNVPLWMLGDDFSTSRQVLRAARKRGLRGEYNSWLPFVIADTVSHTETRTKFLLPDRKDDLCLCHSATNSSQAGIDMAKYFYSESFCFVRDKLIPAGT